MRASRVGQPARAAVPAGQSSRWSGEGSIVESAPRRSKGSSPATSTTSPTTSRRRKPCGSSASSGAVTSSAAKCPPQILGVNFKVAAAAEEAFVHAAANLDVYPYSSDHQQAAKLRSLAECPWPNWPDWGSENDSSERGGGVGCPVGSPTHSDTSSVSWSQSDTESDLLWSTTSSSSGGGGHEPGEVRGTYSFWEELIWGKRRGWKKLQHRRSCLTNLWSFKPETKVDESCDPILVSVSVMGSPGPLRLVVDRNDSVQHTIDFALRRYADQKRQPKLVGPTPFFGLYCRNPDFEALDDEALIGHRSARQFHLYHKERTHLRMEDLAMDEASSCKSSGLTISTAFRTRIRSNVSGMRSWARNLVTSVSHTLTYWVKYLNPRRFYSFVYIASKRAVSL